MKKTYLAITFILLLTGSVVAQKLQHVKGLKANDISCYFTKQGVGIRAGYTAFISNKINLSAIFDYEDGKIDYTNISRYSLMLQPGYTLIKPFKNDYLTAYIPVLAGIENLKSTELNTEKNFFMYHAGIGISNEYNINSIFAILVYFDQMLIGKSKIGIKYNSGGIGLRIKVTNINKKRTVLMYE